MAPNASITFLVPGQRMGTARGATPGAVAESATALALGGRVKDAVRVGTLRSGAQPQRLSAEPGADIVVLHIPNGPSLVLHPETARDLMLAQGEEPQQGATPTQVDVPAQLKWHTVAQTPELRGVTRAGVLSEVSLGSIEIITDLLQGQAAGLAADALGKWLDGRVQPGLYRLRPDALVAFSANNAVSPGDPALKVNAPLLVLMHGTFVDTSKTFERFWKLQSAHVQSLFMRYSDQVFGFDHHTLTATPIANALQLAESLPAGAELHLLTHSRGGLVAEVLARVCDNPNLTDQHLSAFAGDEHAQDKAALLKLSEVVKQKALKVSRIVRVACPSRGTLLASKRLDAYVSILKWALELASVPVLPSLVQFLKEVARSGLEPTRLPGLAAMVPDSPLINWLHQTEDGISGELRVIAGDLEGDSIGSWLKALAADAFFWTDNDLVVQTRSMYGGSPRRDGGALFLLDSGSKVTHFNYFANQRTADAIVSGLVDEKPYGFRTIGPLSWAGKDTSGFRVGKPSGPPESDKPAVFVLPGILGSHLSVAGKRLWLSLRVVGGLERLGYPAPAAPDGPLGMFYDRLSEFLSDTHHVIPFAFDWRQPIEKEAARLAAEVTSALDKRRNGSKPVRFVAHSMGGVLARTMIAYHPNVWQRVLERDGARLLMLGTPNGGSWAPMQVLSGDDTFGSLLAIFGSLFDEAEARQLMANMPGFIQLQADLLDPKLRLDSAETWARLAADDVMRAHVSRRWYKDPLQRKALAWGLPSEAVLKHAVSLRQRLDKQREEELPGYADKLSLVVGTAERTPDGYEIGEDGFVYKDVIRGGDGRVALRSALLPGVRTWQAGCDHSKLPDYEQAFPAYLELLTRGSTVALPTLAGGTRGDQAASPNAVSHVRSRPARARFGAVSPPDSFSAVLRPSVQAEPPPNARSSTPTLRITVLNGNLKFIRQPLMVGHYRSWSLTGSEWVVDNLMGRAMSDSLSLRHYPQEQGAAQVFMNRRVQPENVYPTPRPSSVIVVGLGDEGELRAHGLVQTVRQGVIAWVQRAMDEPGGAPTTIELASTLVGSGGAGVSGGMSARAIAQGVRDANELLAKTGWPTVSHLLLVELYLNRASEAWRELQLLASSAPGQYQIAPIVEEGTGSLRRPLESEYRGADYDLIRADWKDLGAFGATVSYSLDTRRARSEVRAQAAQTQLIREFVSSASNHTSKGQQIGRTLFQLLVPPELEPFLSGNDQIVLELDPKTAGIPWELLDTPDDRRSGSELRPWAIRTRLIRKLRTAVPREQVVDASADDHILVIGDPRCDRRRYPLLPGALAEAKAVAARFGELSSGAVNRVSALVADDEATMIIQALLEHRYRIVHIAGHGLPGADGGVVLSGGVFLGPREIAAMRTVPELVFVNCCHLAARDAEAQPTIYDRASFAATVADQLINIGVRCVIAAGWAVEDEPAKLFASTFYDHLLLGRTFIESVAAAREAAWQAGGNTWAAYQCYGDPQWTYRKSGAVQASVAQPDSTLFSGIASAMALISALDTITVDASYEHRRSLNLDRVRHLEARFASFWPNVGNVAEAYGHAYSAVGAFDDAIRWFELAIAANDASASLRAVQELANLRARRGWQRVDELRTRGTDEDLKQAVASGREEIVGAADTLALISRLKPTIVRESLRGSAAKRRAMLERVAAPREQPRGSEAEDAAIEAMQAAYAEAKRIALDTQDDTIFYPGLNWMAAELVRKYGDDWPGFAEEDIRPIELALQRRLADDPDFWSLIGQTELQLYLAISKRVLHAKADALRAEYVDLHARMPALKSWRTVRDQLAFLFDRLNLPEAEKAAAASLRDLVNSYVDVASTR